MGQALVQITPAEARNFLSQLANLVDDDKAFERFERLFLHVLPDKFRRVPIGPRDQENPLLALIDERSEFIWLMELRSGLRNIWLAPDVRTKAWGAFRLVDAAVIHDTHPWHNASLDVLGSSHGQIAPLPPPTPFEQIFDYVRRNADRLGSCANFDCPARFFFKVRSTQKYCSTVCALPSQRAFKSRWWAENGKNRRRKRARK
jgi:hypothetical protein